MAVLPFVVFGVGTIASAAIGAGVVPDLTNAVLRWKRKLVENAFEEGLDSFKKAKENPEEGDPRVLSDASRWAEDMVRNEKLGKVEPWMAEKLEQAGVIEKAREDEKYLPCSREKWAFDCGIVNRIVCGALGGIFGAAVLSPIVTCGVTPWMAIPAVALLMLLFVLIICDMRTQTLPWQLCAVSAIPSVALALLIWGVSGFGQCVLGAVSLTLALGLVSYVAGAFGFFGGIGRGDMRLIPWIVLPLGINAALWGGVCCLLVMLARAIWKLARKKASVGDYVAMAPGLITWFVVGMAAIACPVQIVSF